MDELVARIMFIDHHSDQTHPVINLNSGMQVVTVQAASSNYACPLYVCSTLKYPGTPTVRLLCVSSAIYEIFFQPFLLYLFK